MNTSVFAQFSLTCHALTFFLRPLIHCDGCGRPVVQAAASTSRLAPLHHHTGGFFYVQQKTHYPSRSFLGYMDGIDCDVPPGLTCDTTDLTLAHGRARYQRYRGSHLEYSTIHARHQAEKQKFSCWLLGSTTYSHRLQCCQDENSTQA